MVTIMVEIRQIFKGSKFGIGGFASGHFVAGTASFELN
jgi:hypothetical protein